MTFWKEKNWKCAAHLKNSVRIFVEKTYKMGCLEGSGVPVLYIGRTVPKGYNPLFSSIFTISYCVKHPSFCYMVNVASSDSFLKWPEQYYVKGIHEVPQHVFSYEPCASFLSFWTIHVFRCTFSNLFLYFTVGNRISRPYVGVNKTKVIENTIED
jgi:hypothetical protein